MSTQDNKHISLMAASYLARGLIGFLFGVISVCKARTHLLWHLSVGASEWGHIAALLSLTSLLPGWRQSRIGRISGLLSCASAIVTLTPLMRAVLVARKLPHHIESFQAPTLSLTDVSPRPAPLVLRDLFLGVSSPDVRCRSLVYATADNEDLSLDLYQPQNNTMNSPCVIIIHGGSWNKGNSRQLWPLNRYLAARGYTVAAINYRLAPKHTFPAALDDVLAAIQYLKANAGLLGIDPHRIVLAGRSAGGHLALLASYQSKDPDIKGAISFYGFADLEYCYRHPSLFPRTFNTKLVLEQFLGGTPNEIPDVYRQASPLSFVGKDSQPTLLIYGDKDVFISEVDTQRLHQRLKQLEIPNFLLCLPWGHHGGDFNFSGPFGQISTYTIERFLASVCALSRQPLAE